MLNKVASTMLCAARITVLGAGFGALSAKRFFERAYLKKYP